jgi:hypothetical protein
MAGAAALLISLAFSCDILAPDGSATELQGVCAKAGAALAKIERQEIAARLSELAGRRNIFIYLQPAHYLKPLERESNGSNTGLH